MKNEFKLCPVCGSTKIQTLARKWLCPDCGFDLYNNVAAAVGIIIYDKDFNVLTEVRAKNPKKGFLALPGGFVDSDERAEEAVLRECREEIGFVPSHISFTGTFPNTYEYKGIVYKTCDMFFSAKLPDSFSSMEAFMNSLSLQQSEVQSLKICSLNKIEDIAAIPFAFESSRQACLLWRKNNE